MELETISDVSEHTHKPNRGLMIALILTVTFGGVELYTGTIGNATVLVADAWHMFTDSITMIVAIILPWILSKAKVHNHKAEAVTAIICGLLLLIPCWEIMEKIVSKFSSQVMPNVKLLTITATLGLLVNVFSIKLIHMGEKHDKHRLSSQGVKLHILGDLIGSVVAIMAGAVSLLSDKDIWADIIGSIILLIILLIGLGRLLYRSISTLARPQIA